MLPGKHLTIARQCLLFAIIFSSIGLLSSCSRKMSFQTSPVVPAARGFVTFKNDNNNNYSVKVKINNLAQPGRLTPPKKEYIVWMITKDNLTRNIGRLKSKSGLFSKRLKASLVTVTTFNPDNFMITAEDDGDILYPGSTVILRTN